MLISSGVEEAYIAHQRKKVNAFTLWPLNKFLNIHFLVSYAQFGDIAPCFWKDFLVAFEVSTETFCKACTVLMWGCSKDFNKKCLRSFFCSRHGQYSPFQLTYYDPKSNSKQFNSSCHQDDFGIQFHHSTIHPSLCIGKFITLVS